MNTSRTKFFTQIALVALAVSLAAVFYLSFGTRGPRSGYRGAASTAAKEDYYCPMHPHYHSEKPGNCPVCAMKLVKVEKVPST